MPSWLRSSRRLSTGNGFHVGWVRAEEEEEDFFDFFVAAGSRSRLYLYVSFPIPIFAPGPAASSRPARVLRRDPLPSIPMPNTFCRCFLALVDDCGLDVVSFHALRGGKAFGSPNPHLCISIEGLAFTPTSGSGGQMLPCGPCAPTRNP